MHSHILGLLGRGHHVEIWCPERLDDHFLPLGDLAEEHVIPIPPGNRKKPFMEALEVARGVRSDILAMDLHCQRCAEQIVAGNFDVLFSNTSRDFAVTSIGRLTDLPRVLYLQEPLRELYEASPELPWSTPDTGSTEGSRSTRRRSGLVRHSLRSRKLGILMREEQRNARAFDRILVNSFYSRESVLRAYGIEAKVCYLGIDTTRFRNLGLPRKNTAIGIGAIVPAKSIERAIEAIALIPDVRPTLEWIGNVCDEAYRRYLEQLALERRVDLQMRVAVSDDELIDALNRASVMIYTPRLEPFGYAPLEAGACGLPVVGVREGGLRETVLDGETGFLTENDPRAFARALEKILSNPGLGRLLGANGRRWITETWTTEHLTDRLEGQLVSAVLQRKQGATG